jgi:NitT/TauT family transport system substrate-binding protein
MGGRKVVAILLALTLLSFAAFASGTQDTKGKAGALTPMKVIFPRSLEVLDDYYLNVALAMNYFQDEGIQISAEGALGTTDSTKLVVQGFGEACLPSPPVLMTAIASELPLTMVFEQDKNYIFGFAVRKDSGLKTIKDLKGKTISVGDAGWTVIMDPLFKKVGGFTSKDVQVVVGGTGRAQLVAQGKADAVFTWEKEYQLWQGQGLDLAVIKGYDEEIGRAHV